MSEISLLQPDDFHVHLRDGIALRDTVSHITNYHHRILVMPNIKPPVRNLQEAIAYKQRIESYIPKGSFEYFLIVGIII